jgi:hypothetical protein
MINTKNFFRSIINKAFFDICYEGNYISSANLTRILKKVIQVMYEDMNEKFDENGTILQELIMKFTKENSNFDDFVRLFPSFSSIQDLTLIFKWYVNSREEEIRHMCDQFSSTLRTLFSD